MSKKLTGIHFYININNLNEIIRKEENSTDSLARTFHSLNTYVCTMEKFSQQFSDIVTVEKFTTTRLHLYITSEHDANQMTKAFVQISYFAKQLADYMKNIGKYNKIDAFGIGIGADYGEFVEFEFNDPDSRLEEMTTIGSPANRAAKLQSHSKNNEIIISKMLYNILPYVIQKLFFDADDVTKIVSIKYYDILPKRANITDFFKVISDDYLQKATACLDYANELAQKNNLGSIEFSESRVPIDYENLSLINAKKVKGIMLYADIRNFTRKVDAFSLNEIEKFTKQVLKGMHNYVVDHDGIHVQFQGDRESGIFHTYKEREENYIIDSLVTAMKLLDLVDQENNSDAHKVRLDIGIGCSIGDVYTTRIGIKNNKFNIAIGETVHQADIAEDKIAGSFEHPKSEIAITKELFEELSLFDSNKAKVIKKEFKACGNQYYVSNTRYSEIENNLQTAILAVNPLEKYGCDISHKKVPPFSLPQKCSFMIKAEIMSEYSRLEYKSNSYPIDKYQTLLFTPLFNVPNDCYVKWQITNTGYEAKNDLRGTIEQSNVQRFGKDMLREEHSRYSGRHLVQCFIMRSSKQCIAMSDYFIVWIK